MSDAGRELDALIAERVFGNAWASVRGGLPRKSCPRYSTEIEAAMRIVEKLWADGTVAHTGHGTYRFQLNRRDGAAAFAHLGFGGDRAELRDAWVCEFSTDPEGDFSTHATGIAETAPHAICLAALQAVGAAPSLPHQRNPQP